MEKLPRGVWPHPDDRQCRLPWRLSEECACVKYGMHGKVLVVRSSIKVLECFANFLGDVQPLGTFFRDFSHQGLFGRLTSFETASGQEEVSIYLDGRNPACTVWYDGVDGSSGMIRVAVYLGAEDVLHLSHDG